ncbi:hypothetical protein ACFWAY_52715 [Rhodococcus sp. NPDC059968]|uniref:hypothetical protein n=1 Tax=Rhodococcus sp. NPDC059968 TaxID=3347017 RepID=UPI00366DC792
MVGSVDVAAALALLLGALPVIVTLRHPSRLADRVHAVSYVLLLVTVTMTTVLAALR